MLGQYGDIILAVEPLAGADGIPRRQAEAEAARALLRRLIACPGAEITHLPDGTPCCDAYRGSLSISHSRHYVAVALCPGRRVGVDIEEPRPGQLRRVASRFMHPDELAIDSSDEALLRAWTIKEAMYKACPVAGLSGTEYRIPQPGKSRALVQGRPLEVIATISRPGYTLSLVAEI